MDLESGRMAKGKPYKWVNDDPINWNDWAYTENAEYKSADRLVDELVDIAQKNGTLLLDIRPPAGLDNSRTYKGKTTRDWQVA